MMSIYVNFIIHDNLNMAYFFGSIRVNLKSKQIKQWPGTDAKRAKLRKAKR